VSINQRKHPGIGHGHPHAVAAKNLAGQVHHANVKVHLGKEPLPKRAFTEVPELHSGMMGKSRTDGTHFAGVGGQDLSRYDANPGNDPLAGAPRGKRLSPVQSVPGMRSQTNEDKPLVPLADIAKAILGEAVISGSTKLTKE
jgi:hypothetical protein